MDDRLITPADLVAEARTWIGTPWRHQQRHKGMGADCGGFILGCLWALDYPPARGYDYKNYSDIPDTGTLRAICDRLLDRTPSYAPGDVVMMRLGGAPQHLGIVGDGYGGLSLIHSYVQARRVREERIDDAWRSAIVQSWRLRAAGA